MKSTAQLVYIATNTDTVGGIFNTFIMFPKVSINASYSIYFDYGIMYIAIHMVFVLKFW